LQEKKWKLNYDQILNISTGEKMKKYLLIAVCFIGLTLTAFAQAGYGTELTGNLLIPLGKYAENYKPGFGALVGFYYDVAENFRLAFVTGYLHSGINESTINGNHTDDGSNWDVSGGVGAIPALLSLRLISPGPGMRLYGMVELGLYTYRSSITGSYTVEGQPDPVPVDESEYRFESGFAAGGGVLFPLNEELSVDANLRYHWINDSEYSDVSTTDGTELGSSKIFTIGVGVNWFFVLPQPK
jgi:opacity protein-like surface antigen